MDIKQGVFDLNHRVRKLGFVFCSKTVIYQNNEIPIVEIIIVVMGRR
jgi:hypothetical protein